MRVRSAESSDSNFVLALTLPLLLVAFTPTGTFGWFAAWNAALFFRSFFPLSMVWVLF